MAQFLFRGFSKSVTTDVCPQNEANSITHIDWIIIFVFCEKDDLCRSMRALKNTLRLLGSGMK